MAPVAQLLIQNVLDTYRSLKWEPNVGPCGDGLDRFLILGMVQEVIQASTIRGVPVGNVKEGVPERLHD